MNVGDEVKIKPNKIFTEYTGHEGSISHISKSIVMIDVGDFSVEVLKSEFDDTVDIIKPFIKLGKLTRCKDCEKSVSCTFPEKEMLYGGCRAGYTKPFVPAGKAARALSKPPLSFIGTESRRMSMSKGGVCEVGDANADCVVSVDHQHRLHLIKVINKATLHPSVESVDEDHYWDGIEVVEEPGIYSTQVYIDFSECFEGDMDSDLRMGDLKSIEASSTQVTMLKAELEQLTNARDRERSAVFTQIRNIIIELEEDGFGEDATKSLKEMVGDA